MTPIGIGLLAVSLSIDALVANVGHGRSLPAGGTGRRSIWCVALTRGAIFGLVEALTPVIGWALGMASHEYLGLVDHWIAFALLGGVGLRMMLNARRDAGAPAPGPRSLGLLLATAVGTSVDAMAVGASLAFLDINILVVALVIGLTTTAMSSAGLLAGRYLGARLGHWLELAGGLFLIGLGSHILLQHLVGVAG